MPAVPLAGKYRLVDIPISNCINSNLKRIYVLTQFNSASLHRHISQSYKFDHFSGGFVEILAAEQTPTSTSWYEGTADAVRKNLTHFLNHDFEYLVILSGDQLYRMDFRRIIAQHIETYADLTVATIPVPRDQAQGLGIMQINEEKRIVKFVEKPKEESVLDSLKVPRDSYDQLGIEGDEDFLLASMGIYVFNRDLIVRLLDNNHTDFGKHIIPDAINQHRVFSYVFQGYWEDIGTIGSFFEANLDLVSELPRFNFFDMAAPVFSRPRFLPGTKINGATIDHAIVSDGCIINHSTIRHSLVGIRSVVGNGSELNRVVLMGGDYYESHASIMENELVGKPRIGIGQNTRIENAIIDKNARIGDNVVIDGAIVDKNCRVGSGARIINESGIQDGPETPEAMICDGIVVVPKDSTVPAGWSLKP